MTSTDIIPRPRLRDRLGFAAGLFRAGWFYLVHPRAPLPAIDGHLVMPVRVPGKSRGGKLAALAEIADKLRTREQAAPLDCMTARRSFGRVQVVASVQGPQYTLEYAKRTPAPALAGAEGTRGAA